MAYKEDVSSADEDCVHDKEENLRIPRSVPTI